MPQKSDGTPEALAPPQPIIAATIMAHTRRSGNVKTVPTMPAANAHLNKNLNMLLNGYVDVPYRDVAHIEPPSPFIFVLP